MGRSGGGSLPLQRLSSAERMRVAHSVLEWATLMFAVRSYAR